MSECQQTPRCWNLRILRREFGATRGCFASFWRLLRVPAGAIALAACQAVKPIPPFALAHPIFATIVRAPNHVVDIMTPTESASSIEDFGKKTQTQRICARFRPVQSLLPVETGLTSLGPEGNFNHRIEQALLKNRKGISH
jgi:hypothetical protein